VKRLLALAERMGLPPSEAIHQVQELTPDTDAPARPADRRTENLR
jgi:hypothetical protein